MAGGHQFARSYAMIAFYAMKVILICECAKSNERVIAVSDLAKSRPQSLNKPFGYNVQDPLWPS